MLHLYQRYEQGHDHPPHIVQTLRSGLLLLHHAQHHLDHYLVDRDHELQDDYVMLVCGLTSLFRLLPGNQEAERKCSVQNE